MSLFFNFGRSVGYAAIPAIRKSKWAWRSLAGSATEAVQAESEFGKAMAAELRLKTGVSNDPESLALVRGILEKLSARVRNKERTFRVDVLRDPSPSAMALPGGFIFISTTMIDFCERNPDELAFVLGHEMAHIIRGHALERMLRRIGAEGLSAVVSRGLLNPVLRESGLKWLQSSHAREAELEADEFAVRMASSAGFDATAALRLLERVANQRKTDGDVGEYFESHPLETERTPPIQALLHAKQGLTQNS